MHTFDINVSLVHLDVNLFYKHLISNLLSYMKRGYHIIEILSTFRGQILEL